MRICYSVILFTRTEGWEGAINGITVICCFTTELDTLGVIISVLKWMVEKGGNEAWGEGRVLDGEILRVTEARIQGPAVSQ
ncbi:hypothetical protein E2C01_063561 [Portunus trituberculatus]|uniref:Uncharacterized protein n=1 Tax=Portunus trituberculatus TaxID=210409 RepID=A0A5B7HJA7_PORTR|nr:hypothetical protein [Portunus trituberculatus]